MNENTEPQALTGLPDPTAAAAELTLPEPPAQLPQPAEKAPEEPEPDPENEPGLQAAEPLPEETAVNTLPDGQPAPVRDPWRNFARIFPDVAAGGKLQPEVVRLIEAGLDPIAAQACYENRQLQLRLNALTAAEKNRSLPGPASGLGPVPEEDAFLQGFNSVRY